MPAYPIARPQKATPRGCNLRGHGRTDEEFDVADRTCLDCGVPLTKKPGRGRWPTRCDIHRRLRKREYPRKSRAKPARAPHPCAACGALTVCPKFCCDRCNTKFQYETQKADGRAAAKAAKASERYRTDPEYREQIRKRWTAYSRAAGRRPRVTGEVSKCPECGGDFAGMVNKVYCSPSCRTRASNRRLRGGCPPASLFAMTSRFGAFAPRLEPITGRIAVGLIVDCPNCSQTMNATGPADRYCVGCGTTLALNPEEVSWVISEKRSTRPSLRVAS